MCIELKEIVREIGAAPLRGYGGYFVGSGISKPSGLPDWEGLFEQIAASLGISLARQDELPRIARYYVNEDSGNRGPLIGRITRALGIAPTESNSYHRAICRTNNTYSLDDEF